MVKLPKQSHHTESLQKALAPGRNMLERSGVRGSDLGCCSSCSDGSADSHHTAYHAGGSPHSVQCKGTTEPREHQAEQSPGEGAQTEPEGPIGSGCGGDRTAGMGWLALLMADARDCNRAPRATRGPALCSPCMMGTQSKGHRWGPWDPGKCQGHSSHLSHEGVPGLPSPPSRPQDPRGQDVRGTQDANTAQDWPSGTLTRMNDGVCVVVGHWKRALQDFVKSHL